MVAHAARVMSAMTGLFRRGEALPEGGTVEEERVLVEKDELRRPKAKGAAKTAGEMNSTGSRRLLKFLPHSAPVAGDSPFAGISHCLALASGVRLAPNSRLPKVERLCDR